MIVATFTTRSNTQDLIHSHESKETNHDTQSQKQIPIRLDHDEPHVLGGVLAQEDLREEME